MSSISPSDVGPPAGLRPCVVDTRRKLQEARAKLRAQHAAGAPGIQVCTKWSDILDEVAIDLFRAAIAESRASEEAADCVALVAHGGYGRRETAPYSDLDLMCLVAPDAPGKVKEVVRVYSQMLYDTGLVVGFSQRAPQEAIDLALRDPTVFTSLVEARFVHGPERLFQRFFAPFVRRARRAGRKLLEAVIDARRQERHKYGDTPNLLEPNVKRSPGGLRDLQLIRWLGCARWGLTEPDALVLSGRLPRRVRNRLLKARDFLLHVRNELHFHAGRAQDVLGKSEQLRIAGQFGYVDEGHALAVESFMREYFSHAAEIRDAAFHFVDEVLEPGFFSSFFVPLWTHRVGGDFRVGPRYIGATSRGRQKVAANLADALRLMTLSCLYDKHIEPATWRAIRDQAELPHDGELTPETSRRFLELLAQPLRLGELLRRLHAARLLERIIPAFGHARCLLQFNQYHKYTVDEHSLRAVERTTQFLHESGPPGEVYRSLKNKRPLHLAVLLHDLGKGFEEDHSIVGERIARETCGQFGVPEAELELVIFLVRRHLDMTHLAFRRDLSDRQVISRFASEVGSAERLNHLYLLSIADLDAVGPGVLTGWKLNLLTELYARTKECLTGSLAADRDMRLAAAQSALKEALGARTTLQKWIESLPSGLLFAAPPAALAEMLTALTQAPPREVLAWSMVDEERRSVRYAVGAQEEIADGVFQRLAGVLSSQGMQILAAEIYSLPGRYILDFFEVHDLDYRDAPPESRLCEVREALKAVLKQSSPPPPNFRRLWGAQSPPANPRLPTRVVIDNQTAQNMTIIDVFAHDRLGLLYTISRTLYELRLNVHVAKISTYLDQVVDVFYVTDLDSGGKITCPERCETIQQRLLEAIERVETAQSPS